LLWTVSGIYFAFNKIELIRGEQYRLATNVEYRIFDRLGQQVIASNKDGNIVYRTYPDGNLLEKLSAEEAKLIASIKTSLEPVSATLITKSSPGSEYRGRSLPIYQITTTSKDDINIYLDPLSGDVLAIRSDSWRMWDFLWSLHIMDYDQRDNINNFLLRLFSILALVSSISGILLFFFGKKK
jgi:hypothetical protein|tara:strand:+ start:828 stop:1376 length:549 start_codon:yes stop_codon:yes gene_type:complete